MFTHCFIYTYTHINLSILKNIHIYQNITYLYYGSFNYIYINNLKYRYYKIFISTDILYFYTIEILNLHKIL